MAHIWVVHEQLKALNVVGYSSKSKGALIEILKAARGDVEATAAEVEAVEEGSDGDADDDGEPEEDEIEEERMSAEQKEVLKRLREEAKPVNRSELTAGRAFFCWDDDRKINYFALVVKENPKPRSPLFRAACLCPASEGTASLYAIDPQFNGDTGSAKKDYARCKLVFDAQPITGEVWRPVEGGWCVIRRS